MLPKCALAAGQLAVPVFTMPRAYAAARYSCGEALNAGADLSDRTQQFT